MINLELFIDSGLSQSHQMHVRTFFQWKSDMSLDFSLLPEATPGSTHFFRFIFASFIINVEVIIYELSKPFLYVN